MLKVSTKIVEINVKLVNKEIWKWFTNDIKKSARDKWKQITEELEV